MSTPKNSSPQSEDEKIYRCLVVDSGPIIKLTGLSALRNKAQEHYTVPAVLSEIRDAKARDHLGQLPFDLKCREPSKEACQKVIAFARKTGDYRSLSAVDIQVLALLYELECEGCEDIDHIRTEPKRMGGSPGNSMVLKKQLKKDSCVDENAQEETEKDATIVQDNSVLEAGAYEEVYDEVSLQSTATSSGPRSWAMMVNSSLKATETASRSDSSPSSATGGKPLKLSLGKDVEKEKLGGQFSDAEEDEVVLSDEKNDRDVDGDSHVDGEGCENENALGDIDDEERDAVVFDAEEEEARINGVANQHRNQEEDLSEDFPSLAASMSISHGGNETVEGDDESSALFTAIAAKERAERERQEALEPKSASGKRYNSFRKYGNIVKPGGVEKREIDGEAEKSKLLTEMLSTKQEADNIEVNNQQSRIMGGVNMSGQGFEVQDDGEGWVTSTTDIKKMKSMGLLDPTRNPHNLTQTSKTKERGPPASQRTACATTDFAMQNVILQMNLELLSVDGMKIRKLKSWVTRCGACFAVYTDGDNRGDRLFCARCGSDFLQRIAASVDAKTGRLRLHLSKKYKNNLRGTKYSLPKPGKGNRFQGDLLLREDQLMMGAWNQKVKMRSGGRARSDAQSIFGSDLASSLGCHADLTKRDDIRVGFGRRNPNSSKFGRERRGKKKKSTEKACGLRRY